MIRLRSSLDRVLPRRPSTAEELENMARRAWVDRGVAVIDPRRITDDWARASVVSEATRLYGPSRAITPSTPAKNRL